MFKFELQWKYIYLNFTLQLNDMKIFLHDKELKLNKIESISMPFRSDLSLNTMEREREREREWGRNFLSLRDRMMKNLILTGEHM